MWAAGLAVGMNDKVYVLLVRFETQTENGDPRRFALCILEKNQVLRTCLLDFLEVIQRGLIKMVINKNNDIIISQQHDRYVYICDDVGQLKHRFETTTFVSRPTLAISEENEIITSCLFSTDVDKYTMTKKGYLKTTMKLPDYEVVSVAFHHAMSKIIVLSRKDDSYFLISCSEYDKVEHTTFFCDDVDVQDITMTFHPSGPIAVITKNNITFI